MIQKVCNQKINKINEKIVDNQSNLNADNNNTTCICLKIVSFLSLIDVVILSNLQL